MHPQMNDFVTLLQTKTNEHYAQRYPTLTAPTYVVDQGRKYHKVVQVDGSHGQRSVHCFVDNDGNVYKAASWKAPAKGVRYNVGKDMEKLEKNFDPYGGYLYARSI
jgi:hypothetical protein